MLDQASKHRGFHWEEHEAVSQAGWAYVVDDQPLYEVDVQIAVAEGAEGGWVVWLGIRSTARG